MLARQVKQLLPAPKIEAAVVVQRDNGRRAPLEALGHEHVRGNPQLRCRLKLQVFPEMIAGVRALNKRRMRFDSKEGCNAACFQQPPLAARRHRGSDRKRGFSV